jgi:hypothetical protein
VKASPHKAARQLFCFMNFVMNLISPLSCLAVFLGIVPFSFLYRASCQQLNRSQPELLPPRAMSPVANGGALLFHFWGIAQYQ